MSISDTLAACLQLVLELPNEHVQIRFLSTTRSKEGSTGREMRATSRTSLVARWGHVESQNYKTKMLNVVAVRRLTAGGRRLKKTLVKSSGVARNSTSALWAVDRGGLTLKRQATSSKPLPLPHALPPPLLPRLSSLLSHLRAPLLPPKDLPRTPVTPRALAARRHLVTLLLGCHRHCWSLASPSPRAAPSRALVPYALQHQSSDELHLPTS